MAMSDPFETTYQGSMQAGESLGNALTQIAGEVSKNIQLNKQRMMIRQQGQQMLQQFGLMKPDGTPDPDKLRDMGAEISSDGTMSIKPMQKMPTLAEQIAALAQGKQQIESAGMDKDYEPTISAKGQPAIKPKTMGFGQAAIQFGKEEAPQIAENVKNGDIVGYQNATAQTKTEVANLLGKEGKANLLSEGALAYKGQQSVLGNAKIEDQKVDTAIKLQDAIDSATDKDGNILLPPNMHTEIALGVARMLSPTGVVPIELEQQLRQGTLREKAANLAIFMGKDPAEVGGTTQSVAKFFANTIKRLGTDAENQRDQYLKGSKSSFKQRLSQGQNAGQGVVNAAGLGKVDEAKVQAYMKKYPNRSRQEIISAMGQ